MVQRVVRASFALFAVAAVSGCGDETLRNLGLEKTPPDEYQVVQQPPLSLPPDYALRPPENAVESTAASSDTVKQVIFRLRGGASSGSAEEKMAASGYTTGQIALVKQAGGAGADESIRKTIDQERSSYADENKSFTDRLIFWSEDKPAGTPIDPAAEAQRLQDQANTGKSPDAAPAPAAPTIVHKGDESGSSGGWFSKLF